MFTSMNKLEDTAYNYGQKIKRDKTMKTLATAIWTARNRIAKLEAENDQLRKALEKIAELNWLDDPHEARRIAKVATVKEAGK